MTNKDLTIVITTYKSEKKNEKCINSISSKYKIIIIENSNSKIFKEKIESKYKNVKCILANANLGYGKANNIGIKEAKTKYVLILNPDTELQNDALNNFFEFAESNEDFAIVGPNQNEFLDINLDTQSKNSRNYRTNKIKGYAMFLNLEKFEKIGFFDENYFLYLEEIDLCKRVIKNNEKIYICPKINIFHYGAKSVDENFRYEIELTRNWHWMWSLFYFNKKHYGYFYALTLIFPKLISSIFKVFFYYLTFNERKNIYLYRLKGIITSMLNKPSWYRPRIL